MTTSNIHSPKGPEMPKPDFDSLTDRQKSVLLHIHDTVKERGYPPSIREIGDAVGLTSTSSVAHQLRTLEKKGFLRRDPNRPRAMEVVSPDSGAATRGYRGNAVSALSESQHDETGSGYERPTPSYVPVVGRIAAGGDADQRLAWRQARRVDDVPGVVDPGLGDGVEVHRLAARRVHRHQPRRHVHRAQQRDHQVCVVAAHP